jgi:Spy/CpxP family protein refolding chaperone
LALFLPLNRIKKHEPKEKEMKKIILLAGVLLSAVYAGDMNQKEARQGLGREERIIRYLDLNQNQVSAIRELRLNQQREIMPLKNKIQELSVQQRLELTSPDPDRKKIEKLIDETASLLKRIKMKNIDLQLSIRKILDKEQRMKFDQWVLSRKKAAGMRPLVKRLRRY